MSAPPERQPAANAGRDQARARGTAVVRALGAAISAGRTYPPEHPVVARSLAGLEAALRPVLAAAGEWRLALTGGAILASGGALDADDRTARSLLEDLTARDIDTIAFRRGVSLDELRRFVALLVPDPRRAGAAPFLERLRREGIRAIEAGHLELEEPAEKRRAEVVRDEAGADVARAYDEALDFIQQAITAFREGRKISLDDAEGFVRSMVDQMGRDRSPALVLTALKSHHAYTFTHVINVCILTVAQAEALGADARTLREFGLAAMMHDIGKTLLPESILSKPGKLDADELALVRRHPQDGASILQDTPGIPDLALIVAVEHHMRYDHGGYPRTRRPRPLHPCSLMTNLADTYDAMRSRRSYQQEHPPEKVAAAVRAGLGTHYHPMLAQAFLRMLGNYPPGTRVKLDTGEEAVVARVNPADPERPVVRMLRDAGGALVRRLEVVDLAETETGGGYKRAIAHSVRPAAPAAAETAPSS